MQAHINLVANRLAMKLAPLLFPSRPNSPQLIAASTDNRASNGRNFDDLEEWVEKFRRRSLVEFSGISTMSARFFAILFRNTRSDE